jgi:hypothetical protein
VALEIIKGRKIERKELMTGRNKIKSNKIKKNKK